ncbi:MAG: DUF962 domain-containing protein [Proteobacteria bacterium]|nr:DUF962 domain-containing protein [Pseudomonadota bacterium]
MPQFDSFEAFWPYYLQEHSRVATRASHFVGTTAVVAAAAYAVARRRPRLLALLPLLGYGPAWVSHVVVERNRPATFQHPWWSLRADFRMWRRMMAGDLWDEDGRGSSI